MVKRILCSLNLLNDENYEVYNYGITLIFNKMVHMIIILFCGALLGYLWESVLFLLIYSQVRKYCGGFHAKNSILCAITTAGVMIVFLFIIHSVDFLKYKVFVVGILFFMSVIILLLSPVDSENKKLDEEEVRIYRLRVLYRLVVINIAALIFAILEVKFVNVLVTAVFIQVCMLLLGLPFSPRYNVRKVRV